MPVSALSAPQTAPYGPRPDSAYDFDYRSLEFSSGSERGPSGPQSALSVPRGASSRPQGASVVGQKDSGELQSPSYALQTDSMRQSTTAAKSYVRLFVAPSSPTSTPSYTYGVQCGDGKWAYDVESCTDVLTRKPAPRSGGSAPDVQTGNVAVQGVVRCSDGSLARSLLDCPIWEVVSARPSWENEAYAPALTAVSVQGA
ncbi:MAG: hypothetical protein M1832_000748 [Thelocarpon impressellum]|nr:MAG: hypothetical protein M1832_000748 [Thelocarpon impressellum]